MAYTRVERSSSKSPSRSPARRSRSRSLPRTMDRSQSRSHSTGDSTNPGNNLYVTGLSTRVTDADLEKHFNREGKVIECHLVMDPRTRESRGFGFVTMETAKDADRCVKYLNHSVLEGRRMTVEKFRKSSTSTSLKSSNVTSASTSLIHQTLPDYVPRAKRSRERTPTPGSYCGARTKDRGQARSPTRSSSRRHERSYSPPRSSQRHRSSSPTKSKDTDRRHKE